MTQVFVSGTWRDDKARPYKDQALHLGRRLAERDFDLACGPGTGISRYVIDGYKGRCPSRNCQILPSAGSTHVGSW